MRTIKRFEELPAPVEEHLHDLPTSSARDGAVREYATVGAERTLDNPLGIYALTPDLIAASRKRSWQSRGGVSRWVRELYAMLDPYLTCHKAESLKATWGELPKCSTSRQVRVGPRKLGQRLAYPSEL